MAFFWDYIIDENWRAGVTIYGDCCYVLNDATLLTTLQAPSWCRCCRNVVAGEVVPSIEEIEREIRELNDPNDKIHQCFSRMMIKRMLADARLRLQWRPKRRSDPRCLKCQSTDIVNISGDIVIDPVSGTRMRLVAGGHASMAYEIRRRLTPEGFVLESDNKGYSDLFDSTDTD